MTTQEKIVVGIIRSSGKSEDGNTLERQQRQISDYAKANNLPMPKIILDHNKSGFKNRKGLVELIGLCNSELVSHVIFCDISRLARNVKLALDLIELFNRKQITFVSLSEKLDTSTASGKFQLHIMLSLAENYRNTISDKMRNCWQHKRQQGLKGAGFVPFGMRLVGDKLVEDKHEQQAIEYMMQMRQAGFSFDRIAISLEKMGYKTRRGKSKWAGKTIQFILQRVTKDETSAA